MRKPIVWILALALVFSLAACGPKAPAETTGPDTANTKAPQQQTQPPTLPPNGEKLEAGLWTLIYDPEVWTYDEEDYYADEEYAELMLIIPQGEDSYKVNVEFSICLEDPGNFREWLHSYGFDAYEYDVNHAYELVNLGGIPCLKQEGNYWGEPCLRYIGRDEASSATVFMEIVGEYEDPQVAQLLAGLTFQAKDIGGEDGPWYWEGEPFSAPDLNVGVGVYSLSSQWLPISDPIITFDTFDHAVAAAGDSVYILGDEFLRRYDFDGSGLTFAEETELGEDYTAIQTDTAGKLWISGFMEPLTAIQNGAQTESYSETDKVTMHPDGQWGISWFSGPECVKFSLAGGSFSGSEIKFPEVSSIVTLLIDENRIYVCGHAADDSGHKVFIYDHSGTLQMTLADEDGEGLGCITFISETENGFLGLDGNMREIILWSPEGAFIGAFDADELFSTNYPWFCAGTVLSDGSMLVIMTEERQDESAMELVAFRLTGF